MTRFAAINLADLPPPDVVETPDFQAIITELKADFIARYPEFTAALESDPVLKLLEVFAWRELKLRARINDASRAVMLATATGADLDNLAALLGVLRHVLDPGDLEASPPVLPTYETDTDFRERAQLALEAFSTAGPQGAYIFHALAADPNVKNVAAYGPDSGLVTPAQVKVVVLARDGNGVADQALLDKVAVALNHIDVRPLATEVFVEAAEIVNYTVDATLTILPGPDPLVVETATREKLDVYVASRHLIGRNVDRFGIGAALSTEGVEDVDMTSPAADIDVSLTQAPYCTGINLTVEVDHG